MVSQDHPKGLVEKVGCCVEGGCQLTLVGQSSLKLLPRTSRGLLVLLKGSFKALDVDTEAVLVGQLFGQLNGEAIGVVEFKSNTPVNNSIFTFQQVG